MPNDREFYPLSTGAFEFPFSRSEESGAQGCGIKPICSETKWVTEWQKKGIFKIPHQKQVPNMTCVLKKDAYKACLAAAGQPIPDDPGMPETGNTTDTPLADIPRPTATVSTAKPVNWKMIGLISLLVLILTTAIVLIIRAKRAGKI